MNQNMEVPRNLGFFAIGVALENIIVFVAQIVIYLLYFLFPTEKSMMAGIVTTVSTIAVWVLVLLGLWKKEWLFSLGIVAGFLMRLMMYYPMIFGTVVEGE